MRDQLVSFGGRCGGVLSAFIISTAICPDAAAQSSSSGRSPVPRLTPRLTPRPKPAPAPAQKPPSDPAPAPKEQESQPVPVDPAPAALPPPVYGALRPPLLPAYKGMDPPPGYVSRSHFHRGFFYGGLITLGITYGAGLIYGGTQDFKGGLGNLAIPIVGPWIALGKRQFECDTYVEPDPSDPTGSAIRASLAADVCQSFLIEETKIAVVLFGIGLGQMAGTVISIVGLTDRTNEWLRADLAGVEFEFDAYAIRGGSGLQARGRF